MHHSLWYAYHPLTSYASQTLICITASDMHHSLWYASQPMICITASDMSYSLWHASQSLICISSSDMRHRLHHMHHRLWYASQPLICITASDMNHIHWCASHQIQCVTASVMFFTLFCITAPDITYFLSTNLFWPKTFMVNKKLITVFRKVFCKLLNVYIATCHDDIITLWNWEHCSFYMYTIVGYWPQCTVPTLFSGNIAVRSLPTLSQQ